MNREPGAEIVVRVMRRSYMSALNVAEVHSKAQDLGLLEEEWFGLLSSLRGIVAFDSRDAHACGRMRESTKALGLSIGDRACLLLGSQLDAEVYTADKIWTELPDSYRIHLIR